MSQTGEKIKVGFVQGVIEPGLVGVVHDQIRWPDSVVGVYDKLVMIETRPFLGEDLYTVMSLNQR